MSLWGGADKEQLSGGAGAEAGTARLSAAWVSAMIYIDNRVGSVELIPALKRIGAPVESSSLPFGDACFEGRGPNGLLTIGVERKTLHDMLQCIDDARYSGHQRIGMKGLYDISILMIEGQWKPHDAQGFLMEGFSGGTTWGYCRYRSQRSMYSKLKRYLMSVSLSGVIVDYTRDLFHSAFNVSEWFQYFQKREHTSLLEIQKIAIPTLNGRPSLVRMWANDLPGVGVKMSGLAERHFRTPIRLANAEESDWLRIPGIGVKSAQEIVRAVWEMKK